jgi:uncharacterized tellurite resistance protein B-like protein
MANLSSLANLFHRDAEHLPSPPLAYPASVSQTAELGEVEPLFADPSDDADATFFMIEYRDAGGAFSRRRVILRQVLQADDGRVMLQFHCCERDAPRSFRLDRVLSVIDLDGEVYEPTRYFRDVLSMDLPQSAAAAHREKQYTALKAAAVIAAAVAATAAVAAVVTPKAGHAPRRAARDGLRILCAVSRSDGTMDPREVDAILRYIETEAAAAGVPTTEEDRAALAEYVRRQRPTQDTLRKCLAAFEEAPKDKQLRLLRGIHAVVVADGHVHEAENAVIASALSTMHLGEQRGQPL